MISLFRMVHRDPLLFLAMMVWWLLLVYAAFYCQRYHQAIGSEQPPGSYSDTDGRTTIGIQEKESPNTVPDRSKNAPGIRPPITKPSDGKTRRVKESRPDPYSRPWFSWIRNEEPEVGNDEPMIPRVPGYYCKKSYEEKIDKTLKTRFVAGRSIMMDRHSVHAMCELLGNQRDKDVLEWGSGGSTLFFSHFARSWISFEHDATFAAIIQEYIEDHGMSASSGSGNVRIELVPNLPDPKNINQMARLHPQRYLNYTNGPRIRYPSRTFDIILNDGIAREQCADSILRNKLLNLDGEGGVQVIHDFERKSYHVVLDRGWTIETLINQDRRHLVILRPTKGY